MAPRLPSPDQIERLLSDDPSRPTRTVREIARDLGLTARQRPGLRRLVARLVDEGRLVAARGRRFGARRQLGDTVGRFARHRAGFGFVTPDDPAETDLFIPPGAQGGAMHGDVVAAEVVDVKADGRREGRISRVVERRSRRITGVIRETYAGGGLVEPLDAGFGFELLVPRGRTEGARSGDLVRVELDEFPLEGRPGRGRVIERLGRPDEPGVDIEVLIRKYDLTPEFPGEVEKEARGLPSRPGDWPLDAREDFTGQMAVTIDGETAKDFDDAVCVVPLEAGGYRLHVHIADVSYFVEEGSALDREAQARGTSVYFPGRVVPMLPERLSNDLCSLRPRRIRLTQGVTIDYDDSGRVRRTRFHRGYIRSRARMTYGEVTAIVEARDKETRRRHRAVVPMLEAAAELARKLERQREKRGAIDFDLPEPELVIALTGETTDIIARRRNVAHRVIEEFMIAANRAVGAHLKAKRAPAMYRVHERPEPTRMAKLADTVSGLGYTVPEPFEGVGPKDLGAIIEAARGRPEEPFIQRVVLRTMALARYDPECFGHFGLALRRYLHFTSPIRRYPDLVVHRALSRLTSGEKLPAGERQEVVARMPELARECSRLERDAESAERESISWKVASFMADRLGDEFKGRIVDIAPHGVTVSIDDPFVEGLIPIRRLGEEYFRYDERRRALVGSGSGTRFRLGQEVTVRLDRVDLTRHFIDFSLAYSGGDGRAGARKRRGKRGAPRRRRAPARSRRR